MHAASGRFNQSLPGLPSSQITADPGNVFTFFNCLNATLRVPGFPAPVTGNIHGRPGSSMPNHDPWTRPSAPEWEPRRQDGPGQDGRRTGRESQSQARSDLSDTVQSKGKYSPIQISHDMWIEEMYFQKLDIRVILINKVSAPFLLSSFGFCLFVEVRRLADRTFHNFRA